MADVPHSPSDRSPFRAQLEEQVHCPSFLATILRHTPPPPSLPFRKRCAGLGTRSHCPDLCFLHRNMLSEPYPPSGLAVSLGRGMRPVFRAARHTSCALRRESSREAAKGILLRGSLTTRGHFHHSSGPGSSEISAPRQQSTWPHHSGMDTPQHGDTTAPKRRPGSTAHNVRFLPATKAQQPTGASQARSH